MFKQISTTKPWSCKSPTNQAALYALQMTQLAQHFKPNSMQISHNISTHECAPNQSTYSSTNNCSNRYQLPNHDLASLLQIKQHYIHSNDRISSAFPFKQYANPLTIYLRIITLSINQLTIQLTIVQRYQQQYIILNVFS